MSIGLAARQARRLAVEAVEGGAGECTVRVAYAPNVPEPLDVQIDVSRGASDARISRDALTLRGSDGLPGYYRPSARVPLDWLR